MAKDNAIGGEELLGSMSKERIVPKKKGTWYLGGKRYLMDGNPISVYIPDNTNMFKIYAETGDIRANINARASNDSPIIIFGGIVPEVIESIDNLETLELLGTSGDYANVIFFRRDE